jgi:hypothetical protein
VNEEVIGKCKVPGRKVTTIEEEGEIEFVALVNRAGEQGRGDFS